MENNKGTPPIQKNLDDKNNGHEIERSTARLFDSKRVDITGFKLNEIMGLTDELRRSGKPTTLMLGTPSVYIGVTNCIFNALLLHAILKLVMAVIVNAPLRKINIPWSADEVTIYPVNLSNPVTNLDIISFKSDLQHEGKKVRVIELPGNNHDFFEAFIEKQTTAGRLDLVKKVLKANEMSYQTDLPPINI